MTGVLVTGGAGYIGSHIAKALAAAGYQPVVLDNFSTGNRWAVKWGPLVEGDVRDYELVADTIARRRISAVIHCAASASVAESVISPQEYFDNNVTGSLTLLRALLDSGVRQFVFSSSCAVYGRQTSDLISEDHPQLPVNPYGESKLFIERVLKWYGQRYGLRSICLRYFNAAGADPDAEIGEDHNPETHLIPLAVLASLRRNRYLKVYGADYPTPDGTAIRDYVHVADLARAHLLALEYLLQGGETEFLNLGTGQGHSVKDVISMTREISGSPVKVRYLERRAGDPAALVANASKAASLLTWIPVLSDLRTIVETAWRWHSRKHLAANSAVPK